jgi:uncharacterized membrane protein YhdT
MDFLKSFLIFKYLNENSKGFSCLFQLFCFIMFIMYIYSLITGNNGN